MTHEPGYPTHETLAHETEAYLVDGFRNVRDGVEAVTGDRNENPLEVFPSAGKVRAGFKIEDLPEDQQRIVKRLESLPLEKKLEVREAATRSDIGGETDVFGCADHKILEAGKKDKLLSEMAVARAEAAAGYGRTEFYIGSPRELDSDETTELQKLLPEDVPVARTEYEMARQLAELQAGFVPLEKPEILPYGYDVDNNYALVEGPTGQFVKLGQRGEVDIVWARLDGVPKVNRPKTADQLLVISRILRAQGDETSSVGIVSGSGFISRRTEGMRAGLEDGRSFEFSAYGRKTIANVKGKAESAPLDDLQINLELNKCFDRLLLLLATAAKMYGEERFNYQRLVELGEPDRK